MSTPCVDRYSGPAGPGPIHETPPRGRRAIGCFPLYPPLELLHSMGLLPVVLWDFQDGARSVDASDRHLHAVRVLRSAPRIFPCARACEGRIMPLGC
ncbi:MAG: hypothetical protein EPN93_11645 [Spirochaetes bacterium]|nr:MAG: hypothetical protein EPN93_11645 [Spirochaetota bacterium]